MAVKHQLNKRGTHPFYPQDLGRRVRVTSDNRNILSLLVAPAWTALPPIFISVDSQAKASLAGLSSTCVQKPFNNQTELTNRSDQPLSTPIRHVITRITPTTLTLINASAHNPMARAMWRWRECAMKLLFMLVIGLSFIGAAKAEKGAIKGSVNERKFVTINDSQGSHCPSGSTASSGCYDPGPLPYGAVCCNDGAKKYWYTPKTQKNLGL